MEQFSLDKWLQDKSRKVVTRDGRPVRIVCWDKLGDYPVIGCVKDSDDYEDLESYNSNGLKYSLNIKDQNDLFFADEEEDEFETTMISFAHTMFDHLLDVNKEVNVEEWKNKLLDLARKEILKDTMDATILDIDAQTIEFGL